MISTHRQSILTGSLTVVGARLLARALQIGFDEAEEAGRALTQLQKIALLESALVAFDGHAEEIEIQIQGEAVLEGYAAGLRNGEPT